MMDRFATSWFMTLFSREFSFDLVARVMDLFVLEGYKVVYRVALALLKNVEKQIVGASFEGIMAVIRTISYEVDADLIMKVLSDCFLLMLIVDS